MTKQEPSSKIQEPNGLDIEIWAFEFVLSFDIGSWSLNFYYKLPSIKHHIHRNRIGKIRLNLI